VPQDRVPMQREGDGLVHVLITARDETSAYRVFDALVERFPGVEPPVPRPARPGLVAFCVRTPTRTPTDRRPGRPAG
jgi:hypothetical protein